MRHALLFCAAAAIAAVPVRQLANAQAAPPVVAPSPAAGMLVPKAMRIGEHDRTVTWFVPEKLPPGRPVVIVLHGTNMTGEMMRRATGMLFERMAEREQFAVAYPDGFARAWNDCRKDVASVAKAANVDDVRFLRSVIQSAVEDHGADPRQVFLFGFSGGAHAAFRLAWEAPEQVAALAAVAASLPPAEGLSCIPAGKPARVLLIKGTADPLNPYPGGRHAAGGTVLSARATADMLAKLHDAGEPAGEVVWRAASDEDPTSVQAISWQRDGRLVVALYTVRDGGHTIPQPVNKFPTQLGTTAKFDSPALAWQFFSGK